MSDKAKKQQKKLTKLQRRLLNSRKQVVRESAIDSMSAIIRRSNPSSFERVGDSIFWSHDD